MGDPIRSSLEDGVYDLEGHNPQGGPPYKGTVSIRREGDLYRLQWRIGQSQSQIGVGLLDGRVLSVGYLDRSGGDCGVVSYRLDGENRLRGDWISVGGRTPGHEILTWNRPLDGPAD
jgi:hypothetical protein